MILLGISGKRESGKSLLAKNLEVYGFKRLSLANPLKEMCKDLYGLTDEQVYGQHKESPTRYKRTDGSFYTPRDILIREGCLKRSIDPLFWCKKLRKEINILHDLGGDKFVIDDVRFLNEVDYFMCEEALFVRIERNQAAIGKAALDDLSETELDSYKDWDFKLEATFNRVPADLEKFSEYLVTHV